MRLSLFAATDRLLAPAPSPERVAWLKGARFAHRGLHGAEGGRPENSLAAFAAAVERGLGIECDVQLSADGEAMVFHDDTLARMTGKRGAVADRSAASLATLRLGGGPEPIPRLTELLALVAGRVPLLIELKLPRRHPAAPLCKAVQRALKSYMGAGYSGAHAVMSFDARVPRWFARHASQTPRGLVMSEADTPGALGPLRRHLALWRARPDFLAADLRDLPSRFAAAQRARGLTVACWTIRSPEQLAHAGHHADAYICEGAGVANAGTPA
jgi:glycerophosphoryl diester phosphodiesterase